MGGAHEERAEDHQPVRGRAIGEASDSDRQEDRRQRVERDHESDRKLIRRELQGMERDCDAAAAKPGLAEKGHQYDQVDRHRNGII
jgi:hypothetical protein